MKTQISNLRSGSKNQVLNSEVDYSILPQATSHVGHAGTNSIEVSEVFAKVVGENPKSIKILIKGFEFELTANFSVAGNLKGYFTTISDDELKVISGITPSKTMNAFLSIYNGNSIEIGNGKNSYSKICPSLVTIL